MNLAPAILVWAQWLSDHSFVITLSLALAAFVAEGLWRVRTRTSQKSTSTVIEPWAGTWLANALLLAVAMAVSWSLEPWLSPWFTQALSGKTGLLVWFGFDHNPSIAHIILGIFLLDFVAYALHRMMHGVPIFWSVHQVHHSDTEMNASTHFRQHPLALIPTIAMQLPLLWLLGIPGVSWVLYAVLASVVELWHHATFRLPAGVDRWLSFIAITPNFHRTHHHPERLFHDANYGSVFSLWDRLFGTVASAPLNATTGLREWRPTRANGTHSFWACLLMPFQRARSAVPGEGTLAATPSARKRKTHHKFQTIDGGKS